MSTVPASPGAPAVPPRPDTAEEPALAATLERVTLLVEDTDERVSALLNPSSVELRRRSGVAWLQDRPGTIAGAPAADDMLIATGGGRTGITLELLFDVELSTLGRAAADVRELTGGLWSLSENRTRPFGPPALRLVWGKAWNVPVVIEAVSERLERFDRSGAPRRSWLRLRLLRVPDSTAPATPRPDPGTVPELPVTPRAPWPDVPGVTHHQVVGTGRTDGDGPDGERLDELAARYLGHPGFWRHLAAVNDVSDPPWVRPGQVLVIPPVEMLRPPEPAAREIGHAPTIGAPAERAR